MTPLPGTLRCRLPLWSGSSRPTALPAAWRRSLGGWRYSKLDRHRGFLLCRIAETNDLTMPQLAAELAGPGYEVASASISALVPAPGLPLQKNAAGRRTRALRHPPHARALEAGRQRRTRQEPHRLVFLDETGATTKMTRLRGRCVECQRLYAKAPFGRWLPRPSWRACAVMA